jgi:hypothetical protein
MEESSIKHIYTTPSPFPLPTPSIIHLRRTVTLLPRRRLRRPRRRCSRRASRAFPTEALPYIANDRARRSRDGTPDDVEDARCGLGPAARVDVRLGVVGRRRRELGGG